MKLENIKNGMIVKTRDGDYHLVMDNKKEEGFRLLDIVENTGEKVVFNLSDGNYPIGNYLDLDDYKENLTNLSNKEFDIMYIYTLEYFGELFRGNFKKHLTCIWKREETKEMTVEELEKELGYKIKIVGDK